MDSWIGLVFIAVVVFIFAGRAITHWWFRINEQIAELKAMHAALDKLNTAIDIQNNGLQAMYTEVRSIRSTLAPPATTTNLSASTPASYVSQQPPPA